jgi:hypothetical protein
MNTNVQTMIDLTRKLERQATLTRYQPGEESEAERLAHALCDIRDSFDKYLHVLFPKLVAAGDEEVMDCLEEIGDEVRHIAYHLRDSKFLLMYVQQA